MKKLFITVLLVILSVAGLYGCRPDVVTEEKVTFDKIFVSNSAISSYTSANSLFSLPEGCTLYYTGTAKDYSTSYVTTMEAFLVRKSVTTGETTTVYYGMYGKTGNVVVPVNYIDFAVYYGYILVGDSEGKGYLYNKNGQIVVSAASTSYIQPISADYIAVRTVAGWCNIYNSSGEKVKNSSNAEIEIKGLPTDFKAVDNYIIKSVTVNKIPEAYIYDLTAGVWKANGKFDFVESSSYSLDVYYLGNGKFYCYTLNSEATVDSYDFQNISGDYCLSEIWIYDAVQDTITYQNKSVLYSSIINSYYYEETSSLLDINSQLQKGYSFVSAALVVQADKTTAYDQYIMDSNCKVLVSMLATLGDNVEYNASEDDYRDVLLTYIGDIGFSNTTSGNLKIYDKYGNVILNKEDATYSGVFVNNGVITALKTQTVGGTETSYYVAYDLQGNEIIPASRRYTSLTAFVGGYALAEYKDSSSKLKIVMVDINGVPSTPDVNAIKNSSQTVTGYYYKTGVYVFKNSTTSKYGLKAFDGTVLVSDTADNVIIAKYGIKEIFFCTIINNIFTVYSIS